VADRILRAHVLPAGASRAVTKWRACSTRRSALPGSGSAIVPIDVRDRDVHVQRFLDCSPLTFPILLDRAPVAANHALLGAREGNWLAYNFGRDIALPGSSGARLPFVIYPQAESAAARFDCLEPEPFKYRIRATEVTA
jgi:hypothetical protein